MADSNGVVCLSPLSEKQRIYIYVILLIILKFCILI